jgi:hypothetical protein
MPKGKRGGAKPGERRGGRKKGTPNKVTIAAREAFARFVDGNAHRLQGWLDQIANGIKNPKKPGEYLVQPDPRKAFELVHSMSEFHVPKLARTEISGPGGGAIITESTNTNTNVNVAVTDEDAMRAYLTMLKPTE